MEKPKIDHSGDGLLILRVTNWIVAAEIVGRLNYIMRVTLLSARGVEVG